MATTMKKPGTRGGGDLYEADIVAWAEMQAEALRAGRFEGLDLENLAEEIADVGKREAQAVESHLEALVLHLLKWHHQPQYRSKSWEATIRLARSKVAKLLQDSPSLRPRLPKMLERTYPDARVRAGAETGLPEDTFPAACPFSVDQVVGEWMPEA